MLINIEGFEIKIFLLSDDINVVFFFKKKTILNLISARKLIILM